MSDLPAGAVPVDMNGQPISTSAPASTKVQFVPKEPITITLPDGRTVGMEQPKVSLSNAIAGVLANVDYKNQTMMQLERQRVRSLLYITHINGIPKTRISDPISRAGLEQELGDEFLDDLFLKWTEHFVSNADLSVAKKS
jgi:hypothetical protein